ncbi:MAG TPA: hypothetical protein VF263_08135 [Longimicrobiaceae bacterium]
MPNRVFRDVYVDGVDLARLQRALELHVERLGNGRFRVSGHAEPHHVNLRDLDHTCDCGDVVWRHDPPRTVIRCKHELACRLSMGEPLLLRLVGFLTGLLVARIHELERAARPSPIRLTSRVRKLASERTGVPVDDLAFKRRPDPFDPTVEVRLARTTRLLGTIARANGGVDFVPELAAA